MRVFISYRRGDAVALAGRLYDRLGGRIGVDSVFMDHESIPVGQDFRQAISRSVIQSDVLLVLIGPKWVELLERSSTTPDLVVEEIATALEHKVSVIPVLLGNTAMPQESSLPLRIQALGSRNALKLEPGERFASDFERLMKALPSTHSPWFTLVQRVRKWLGQ